MKFLAILKDSLKETIDSSVFLAVLVLSGLAFLLMATVSFEPNPPAEGLDKLADKFPDRITFNVPGVGKMPFGDRITRFTVTKVADFEGVKQPWQHEYEFTLEARDQDALGTRATILFEILGEEERRDKDNPTRDSRARRFRTGLEEELKDIQSRQQKKGGEGRQMPEQIRTAILKRLEQEAKSLPAEELEAFVKSQLRTQGNWEVREVKLVELPADQRITKIKRRVMVPDGEEVKSRVEEVDGEVMNFRIKLTPQDSTYRVWPHRARVLFGAIPLGSSSQPGRFVYNILYYGIGWFGAPMIMLLASVITAFYIPNMLRKGTIDLLLAKPINRLALLLYKYAGGLTFMFLTTAFLITGLWVALGIRSGIWEPAFLLLIPVLTFQFALFYALSTLIAVLTRSPIVCILGCVLLYGVLLGIGTFYMFTNFLKQASGNRNDSETPSWVQPTAQIVHGVAPHFYDLFWLTEKKVYEDLIRPADAEMQQRTKDYAHYNWGESIAVTCGWIALFLILACWRFAVKDY